MEWADVHCTRKVETLCQKAPKPEVTVPSKTVGGSLCAVSPKSRMKCGFPGITKSQCEQRGCCFNSKTVGATWCFKPKGWTVPSKPVGGSLCVVSPKSRMKCGFPGITKSQCEQRGCCFNSKTVGVTWCFKPKG